MHKRNKSISQEGAQTMGALSEEARAARREYDKQRRAARTPEQVEADRTYHREWQRRNPEKTAASRERYWKKKGEELKARNA